MNQPQSATPIETSPNAPSHRRGSNVESPDRPADDQQNEERAQRDTAAVEPAPEEPPVDETDALSMGGPDSLEDIEDDDRDGIER